MLKKSTFNGGRKILRKSTLVIVVLLVLSVLVFTACAPRAEQVAPAPVFTPASELVPPPGKSFRVLPVDKVAEDEIRIASIMVQNNPFGMAVMEGVDHAEKILADRNVRVDFISVPDFDPQGFHDAIESAITAQYDAITFFGLSEALTPIVNRGVEEGILMFSFNTEPGMDSKRHAYWGQDGFAGGQKSAQLLMDAMGGTGKYAIITGSFSVLGHELRRTGARSIFDKNPNMVLVGEFENQDKAEEAYNITQNLLTAHPDLKGIYVTAGGPFGAAKAIQDAGLTGKIKIVAHDWMEETIAFVRSGEITAVLDQDPFNQGFAPVVSAFNQLAGGIVPEEINWFEGDVATPENVDEKVPLR